jgi:HPt (histidine-containing phosphotransfer) domain-containing protein/HAMP domain-containing protein
VTAPKPRIGSIQFKIVAIIILVLLLGTGGSLAVTLKNQRDNLLAVNQQALTLNTDMLVTVIRSIMLSGEAPIAQRTMSGLAGLTGFESVGIYRTDGTVAFHDYATVDQVNANQDMTVFQRTPRAEFRRLDSEYLTEVLQTRTPHGPVENLERRELEYFFPILNYAECRTCHGEGEFVRGVAHFRISIAGIYEQIGLARNILIGLFAVTGIAIAVAMILSLHRAIISPVLRIGEVVASVGSGDLEAAVTVDSRDEIGNLGLKINEMIGGLKERDRLVIENERIETRNRENRKYLDNIQEGLLLIGPDLRISDQYSHFVTRLFRTETVAGLSVLDFLYPDVEGQAEERRELEQFLTMLFENINADMEMILQINPLEEVRLPLRGKDGEAEEIVFNTLFHRIWNEDDPDRVENVMMIFQDKTEITRVQKELDVERQRSQSEVEHIASLLRAGPQAFVDFVDDAHRALEMLEQYRYHLKEPSAAQRLFREVHTLKGTARYLEFNHIAETAHAIEDVMVGDESREASDLAPLVAALSEQV